MERPFVEEKMRDGTFDPFVQRTGAK